jgi:two-component system sensor histidine kinase MprB
VLARLGRTSFRRRLILLSTVAVATAVIAASGIVYLVTRGQLRGQVDDELTSLVEDIAGTDEAPAPITLQPSPDQRRLFFLPREPLGGRAGYAQIVQPDGNVIRPRDEDFTLPVNQRILAVAAGRADSFFADETIGGVHARLYTKRLDTGVTIEAVHTLEEVDRNLRDIALGLTLITLGGIALAVWLGRLVARAALRPVVRLTDAAEHVARTRDLTRRMHASGSDELSRLGASFNSMLEALENSQKAQRQLVADASHELRTPLTSLRTNVEVLARADLLSPEERKRLLGDVVAQLEELTDLVAALVDLARGDEPEHIVEEVRLDDVVENAIERARRHDPDKHFEVEAEPCLVRGSAERLERAVSNLLDNAAKWSPPGGRVEVGVRDGTVTVRDHGPGVDPQDLPYIFDRFYRARAARGLPGSGLGLAIVRQVADSHGGHVRAENAPGGGTLMRFELPPLPLGELPKHDDGALPTAQTRALPPAAVDS